jgi:hypothetical protein
LLALALFWAFGSISAFGQIVPGALDPGYRFRANTAFVPRAMSLEPDGRLVVMPGGVGGGSGVHILSATTGARETQLFSPVLDTRTDRHTLLRQTSGRLIARVFSVQSGGKTLNGFGAFGLDGNATPRSTFRPCPPAARVASPARPT